MGENLGNTCNWIIELGIVLICHLTTYAICIYLH